MTNSKELFNDLVSRVTLAEDKSEIQSIIYLLLEKKMKLTRMEVLSNKTIHSVDPTSFDIYIQQINLHVPIQYILGEAEFYGRTLNVNSSVLIPRPETELLIHEIVSDCKTPSPGILDIGTGSGCIAITLALEIPTATVYATDISRDAINIASKNASVLGASIAIHEHNILTDEITFGQFDVIVSNPPYISHPEKKEMKRNVLDYEPHLALFVPDEDPLVFYKAIASKSKKALLPGGTVWVEINEHFGKEVVTLFEEQGFHSIRIIKDLDQKDRMVVAYTNSSPIQKT
jgi:release factor glutamine methyltransferase